MISKVYVSEDGVNFSQPFIYHFDVTEFIKANTGKKVEKEPVLSEDIKAGEVDFDKAPKKVGMLLCTVQAYKKAVELPITKNEALALAEEATRIYYGKEKVTPLGGYEYPSSSGRRPEYNEEMNTIGCYLEDSQISVDTIRGEIKNLASTNFGAVEHSKKFLHTIIKYGIIRNKHGNIKYGNDLSDEIIVNGNFVPCYKLDEAIKTALSNGYKDRGARMIEQIR